MRVRLLFIAGIALGYVIGARAGRPAYDALVDRLGAASSDPRVQQAGEKAKAVLEDKVPKAADALGKAASTAAGAADAAKKASDESSSDASSDASKESAPTPSTTPAPTPTPEESAPTAPPLPAPHEPLSAPGSGPIPTPGDIAPPKES